MAWKQSSIEYMCVDGRLWFKMPKKNMDDIIGWLQKSRDEKRFACSFNMSAEFEYIFQCKTIFIHSFIHNGKLCESIFHQWELRAVHRMSFIKMLCNLNKSITLCLLMNNNIIGFQILLLGRKLTLFQFVKITNTFKRPWLKSNCLAKSKILVLARQLFYVPISHSLSHGVPK